jgi:hypothetical protein
VVIAALMAQVFPWNALNSRMDAGFLGWHATGMVLKFFSLWIKYCASICPADTHADGLPRRRSERVAMGVICSKYNINKIYCPVIPHCFSGDKIVVDIPE